MMMSCICCAFPFQVLTDTRSLQKEINMFSGQLDRTFAVTDELIFKVCVLADEHMQLYTHSDTHTYFPECRGEADMTSCTRVYFTLQ